VRWDVSQEKLSSLSPKTRELVRDLKNDRPVVVDAFVSPNVPEAYVQTRLNLLSVLREIKSLGGKHLQVHVYDTEQSSSEADFAQKRYGIEPRHVQTRDHGEISDAPLFLYVAVNCGPGQKVPPVFIDRGIPIEYELVRSICTVAESKRKKLGVLTTDVPLYGGLNMQNFSTNPNWPIIDELEKQYEVVQVDPAKPITDKFDVLLAVEPSMLGPQEMDRFVGLVQSGVPTAIFEDPALVSMAGMGSMPGTSAPRQPPGGMNPMYRMQAPQKGDIRSLWRLLGVDFTANRIIWQKYNPYPKVDVLKDEPEVVFVDAGCGAKHPFGETDPISAGIQQLAFIFGGAVSKTSSSNLTFTPLVTTGENTGYEDYHDVAAMASPFGQRSKRRQIPSGTAYTLAAHIQGKVPLGPLPGDPESGDTDKTKADKKPKEANINVVLVADVDLMSTSIFRIREQGDISESGVNFQIDNVPFVLNVLDSLAGDNRFMDIRMRRPKHRTLTRVDEHTQAAAQNIVKITENYYKKQEAEEEKAKKEIEDKLAEFRQQKGRDVTRMQQELDLLGRDLQRRFDQNMERLKKEHAKEIAEKENNLAVDVRRVQAQYKLWAVILPPIPPLAVAIVVFGIRRTREREGVARSRLR
jgi:ABC-2 type transport system permease protein